MKMKLLLAAMAAFPLYAQEVENDLPTERKTVRNESYYHDDTPLNAVHSIYSDIFIHKWLDAPHDGMEPISQAAQDKISDTYLAHWRQEAETRTDADAKAKAFGNLGEGLIYRERWAEAEAVYSNMLATAKSQQYLSQAWNGIAEAQLGAGRKDDALRTIREFASKKLKSGGYYNGGRSRHKSYHGVIFHAKYWLEPERWMDDLKMPRYTGNRAFPEAQKANYSDTFVKAQAIDLYLSAVDVRDARVRLLAKKLKSRGFKLNGGAGRGSGYKLEIALDPNAKVEKKEGYTLVATRNGCKIAARDKQGVLWGIVSFLQILDPGTKKMRVCEIEDWPDCPRRGYYGRTWTSSCEFAVFNKLNYITHKPHYLSLAEHTPFRVFCTAEECKAFSDFGLEFYGGCGNYTMDVAWPVCWRVSVAMQIDELKKWAKLGLNVYYPYDDARYWESSTYTQEERDSGLKPSETDAKRIAEIYNAVKAEYPNFKMQFCPPFYWGPTKGHPYPDDRTKYLKSIAEHLPKEIDVIWTGERVGSHTKHQRDCLWFAGLIGRKPSLFQNKTGPHNYLSYVNDRTRWDKWFYPGFVSEDMAGIQKNSDTPGECPQITSLADYLWNVKAYDATRSIKRGLDNYAGKDVFETLEPAHKILCEYDRYHKYGTVTDSMRFKTLEDVMADEKVVREATAKAKGLMVSTNQFNRGMGAWNRAAGWMKGIVAYKRKHPDPWAEERKFIANDMKDAETQCGYKPDSADIFYTGIAFCDLYGFYIPSKSKRDWHPIATSRVVGRLSPGQTAFVKANLKAAPKGPVKAFIGAYTSLSKFQVLVNGEVGFDGKVKPTKGEQGAPLFVELELPANLFKRGENIVTLKNAGRGETHIVYMVLRP